MRARFLGLAGLTAALALSTPAFADVLLPGQGGGTATCGLAPGDNCLQFSDFTVFSLALLQFQATNSDSPPKSGDAYYVPSSPGALQNAIVVATGANGLTNTGVNMDNPYDTPNNVPQNNLANFLMHQPDPAPTFSGDNIHEPLTTVNNPTTPVDGAPGGVASGTMPLWDIKVDTLTTYLNGGALDFFFNLNQTNSAGGTYLQTPQDMLAFLEVTLTSADGLTHTSFRLDGNNCTGGSNCDPAQGVSQTANVNDILPTSGDKWAYVHGTICALSNGAVIDLGPCTAGEVAAGGKNIDQNLGANNASFALYSDRLQRALSTFAGGTMSVDLRMAAENNGYEQLFIFAGNAIPNTFVPEPLTITLFGAGLLGVGLLRRRKKIKV